MPTNIAEVALHLRFGHKGVADQIWLIEPIYSLEPLMSKGWDVLLETELGSIGVLRDPGVRVRLEVRGGKLTLFVQDYSPRQPDPGFSRPVRPVHGVEHVDVA